MPSLARTKVRPVSRPDRKQVCSRFVLKTCHRQLFLTRRARLSLHISTTTLIRKFQGCFFVQKGKNVLSTYFLFVSFKSFYTKNRSKISTTRKRLMPIIKRFPDKKTIWGIIKHFEKIIKRILNYLCSPWSGSRT